MDEATDVTELERNHDLTAAHVAQLDVGTLNAVMRGR